MADNFDNMGVASSLATMATVGKNTVFSLQTSLTFENCQALEDVVNKVIEDNSNDIVLDCRSVAFFDSKALEMLLRIYEVLKGRGGLLKFANLNAICRDIFIATRVTHVFHVYGDIAEAARSRS